jgi:signal transduction histidine kinase/ligand-binding sensor domain-containing protein
MSVKNQIKSFIIVTFMFICSTASAQLIRKAVMINSDIGLSQNSVYSICQDSKGFLWIGTGDGLNRYDGKECRHFGKSGDPGRSLKGFLITYKMQEDNQHCLWFSTERNLVSYNQVTNTFTDIIPQKNDTALIGNKVLLSIDTVAHLVWFLSPGIYLHSYNYVEKVFHNYELPVAHSDKNPFVSPFGTADKNGNIWITSLNGLFCFDRKTASWKQFLKGKKINEVCVDISGAIWVINEDSVSSFNPQNKTINTLKNHGSKAGSYLSITSDPTGKVWIGTLDGNLYLAKLDTGELSFAGNINELTGSDNILEMQCIYADTSNLLWIGTEGGGVVKLDMNPVNFLKYPSTGPDPLNSLYIKSVFCDDDGKVWIGTFKKWIYILDPQTQEAVKLPVPPKIFSAKSRGIVFSIKKDNEGIYWIGYDGMLIAYNKKTKQFFFHPLPLYKNETQTLINHIRIENNCLFVSAITGLYKVTSSQQGRVTQFSRIVTYAVSESLATQDGSLWVSSLYSGLTELSPVEKKLFPESLSKNGLRCIIEDKEGNFIWGASQTGLLAYHIPSGKLKFYDESNGLINTYLYGIVKNGQEMWVSSNRGLAKGELSFRKGEIFPDISFTCYSKEEGLQSHEFNTGAYGQSQNGTIFFGGIDGLNWFKPENITRNPYKPTVVITGLKINDQPYAENPTPEYLKRIHTTYANNTISIKFIGLEFSNPQNIYYRFKLDHLEKKWTEVKNPQEVRYANLPAGDYTFRIIAANADNVLSDETSLVISILPPFYKMWWFRIAMAVLILVIAIFITHKTAQIKLKNRIRVLEKEKALEEERHRISKEMHDDLGAGLTQISLISQSAKRRSKRGTLPSEEINDISETSKKLIENVNEIIWAMNPDFDTLSGMIAYLREQISKLLEYSGKEFHLQMPENFTDFNIANTRRKNILMLVKEAVNNAIKHSKASSVEVNMELVNQTLQISIKDNGTGFDMQKQTMGNGLKNYVYRSGLLNGTAKIASDENGTHVYFEIPLVV